MDELHFSFDFCILGLQFSCHKQAGVSHTALLSGMFFVNYTEFISIARNRLIPNTANSSYRRTNVTGDYSDVAPGSAPA